MGSGFKTVQHADALYPFFESALKTRERLLGAEHPDTLLSLNNLASLLSKIGRYEEAEPLYRRALKTRERVLGAEHPKTLSSLNNLADLLYKTGRYEEAKPLSRRAVEGAVKVLGKEHPHTKVYSKLLKAIEDRLNGNDPLE